VKTFSSNHYVSSVFQSDGHARPEKSVSVHWIAVRIYGTSSVTDGDQCDRSAELFAMFDSRKERIMGLMDQVGQAVGGMLGGQGGQNPLLQAVASLLGKDSGIGGLAGLVQAFQKNGLGEIVNSWVSTGQNLPVTPNQIEQGLGSDLLNQLAGKAGLSSGAVGSQLAGLLPDLVDKLTPNGKIEAGGLEQLMKLVQGMK
jgi:uncharacterized protein YidB (DUF937 family)